MISPEIGHGPNPSPFYEITASAKKWRDLGVKAKRTELLLKIAIIATLITIFGVAITCVILNLKGVYQFTPLPLSGGIPVVLILLGLWGVCNFDRWRNGFDRNLKNQQGREQVVKVLTTCDLQGVCKEFYKRKGGLAPLVHEGFFLEEQGNTLRGFFEALQKNNRLIADYKRQFFLKDEIQKGHYPERYHRALTENDEMNAAWDAMQKDLIQQYGVNVPIRTSPPSAPPIKKIPQAERMLRPTLDALLWKDLDLDLQFVEVVIKIVCVTALILLVIGMATAIYFCCTTTSTHTLHSGTVIEESNAGLSALPGLFGTAAGVALVAGYFTSNFERWRNGYQFEDLLKVAARDAYIHFLTEGSLEEVFKQLYKDNGGLRPLVRRGFLKISQAVELRSLFKRYAALQADLKGYKKVQNIEVLNHLKKTKAYQSLLKTKQDLDMAWRALQEEVRTNFFIPKTLEGEKEISPAAQPKTKEGAVKEISGCGTTYQDLPNEMQQLILNHLTLSELATFMRMDRRAYGNIKAILPKRLKRYGIPIRTFLRNMRILVKRRDIPSQYWVKHRGKVDLEGTLLNILSLKGDDQEEAATILGRALIKYMQYQPSDLMIETLLLMSPHLEARDSKGNTPLLRALYGVNSTIVMKLIEAGADANAVNQEGITPLILAVSNHKWAIVKKLLENGATGSMNLKNGDNGNTALHLAARANDINKVKVLLKYGANKQIRNSRGFKPEEYTSNVVIANHIANFTPPTIVD